MLLTVTICTGCTPWNMVTPDSYEDVHGAPDSNANVDPVDLNLLAIVGDYHIPATTDPAVLVIRWDGTFDWRFHSCDSFSGGSGLIVNSDASLEMVAQAPAYFPFGNGTCLVERVSIDPVEGGGLHTTVVCSAEESIVIAWDAGLVCAIFNTSGQNAYCEGTFPCDCYDGIPIAGVPPCVD